MTDASWTAEPLSSSRQESVCAGRRALLLVNHRSRRGADNASDIATCLRERGLEVEEYMPRQGRDARAIIRERARYLDMIIVGGGDGTLNTVLQAVLWSGLPLGVVPMGTANDLARTLGLPTTLEQACDVIAAGQVKPIDLGWVNEKPFFNAANIGLAVEVTHRLTGASKRRWGVVGYALAALDAMRAMRPFAAEVICDGQVHGLRTIQITVGNGRYHGGGLAVAEDAAIDDGRLDLYSLRPMEPWRLLAMVPSMRRGEQHKWERVDALSGREIIIRTRRPMRVITDGEFTTWTPATFRVMPGALSVFAPADAPAQVPAGGTKESAAKESADSEQDAAR